MHPGEDTLTFHFPVLTAQTAPVLSVDLLSQHTLLNPVSGFPADLSPAPDSRFPLLGTSSDVHKTWERIHLGGDLDPARALMLHEVIWVLQHHPRDLGTLHNTTLFRTVTDRMKHLLDPADLARLLGPENGERRLFNTEIYAARKYAEAQDTRLRLAAAERQVRDAGELRAGHDLGELSIDGKIRAHCTVSAPETPGGTIIGRDGQFGVEYVVGRNRTRMQVRMRPLGLLYARQLAVEQKALRKQSA